MEQQDWKIQYNLITQMGFKKPRDPYQIH